MAFLQREGYLEGPFAKALAFFWSEGIFKESLALSVNKTECTCSTADDVETNGRSEKILAYFENHYRFVKLERVYPQ